MTSKTSRIEKVERDDLSFFFRVYKSQQFQRAATSCGFSSSQNNLNDSLTSPEATLLDENGFPIVGPLNAFTPDVIQVFQEAAKLIDESNEIKQQAMSQIKLAFNDAKAYSLTVNQSVAQKLADIITLAVRNIIVRRDFCNRLFLL